MLVRMFGAHRHPTIIRENASVNAHVGDARPGRHERQVGDPQPVRTISVELAVDQVRMPDVAFPRPGGADPLRTVDATDMKLAHQPGDLITTDIEASPTGCLPQLPRAIHPEIIPPQLKQHRPEHRVALGSRRRPTGLRG
jgi:hypothetical protein